MQFPVPLVPGTLILREKRFLAHVRLDDGQVVIAHTNNSGSMKGCSDPGSRVWLSPAEDPKRKLKWTWEIVHTGPEAVPVGINTSLPNALAAEAASQQLIPELSGYDRVRREVRYGSERSRIDVLLERGPDDAPERCWVEVKNVTLVRGRVALFPDAVTTRGRKHLRELAAQVEAGDRAVLLWIVQRQDVDAAGPADDIDPEYGETLRDAAARGVEILAWQAEVTPQAVTLVRALPVHLRMP